MTRPDNYEAQCEGKGRFPTPGRAQKIARRLNRTRDARLNVYHCPHCKRFHLGERNR